jgi:hypothetical protein
MPEEHRMSRIVEVDEQGTIRLPLAELPHIKPHSRFEVEEAGEGLILRPAGTPQSPSLSTEAWIEALYRWAREPQPPAPPPSDESLRRENIYE